MPWLSIIMNILDFNKLFYCSSVWNNTTQANLDKLQAVQNFTYRILCEKPKEICDWLAGYQSGNNFISVLLFSQGCAPEYLASKLVKNSATLTRTTKNSQLLNIPPFLTASSQRTFHF